MSNTTAPTDDLARAIDEMQSTDPRFRAVGDAIAELVTLTARTTPAAAPSTPGTELATLRAGLDTGAVDPARAASVLADMLACAASVCVALGRTAVPGSEVDRIAAEAADHAAHAADDLDRLRTALRRR